MTAARKVRDFAARQNSGSYLAVTALMKDAQKGMDEMSRVYNETGRDLYIGQGDREHD
tara:strand:+ start:1123 stop:1296 length:174 start_codon:yes stop_codon:yes gene_type:complete